MTTQLSQAPDTDGAANVDPAALTETAEVDERGAIFAAAVHALASVQHGELPATLM